MNHLEFFFEINKNEKIVIQCEENLMSADSCAECLAFLLIDGKQYTIFYDFISYTLQTLIYFLKQAIAHKLKVHKSITNDLGYLWNQGLQKKAWLKLC